MRFITIGALFLLLVTGVLFSMHKWLKKSGYIRFLYVVMLLSAAGAAGIFLMGVIYVCLPFNIFLNRWTFYIMGWKAASGGADGPFAAAVAGIWIAGIIRSFCSNRKEEKALFCLCRMNQPITDCRIQDRFYDVAVKAGIKNVPMLFSNTAVSIPFLKGIRRAAVILPENPLSSQEQILVFAHELTHYRNHDLFYRYFLKIVLGIYWFFPLGSMWMEMLVELQETLCDIEVCRSYGNSFSAKIYYSTILSISSRKMNLPVQKSGWQISGLAEHISQLERRIGNMFGYRNGTRRKGIETIIMVAVSFLFLGNVFTGMYWPDILVGMDKVSTEIELHMEVSEIFMDGLEADIKDIIKGADGKKNQQKLQWDRLTSYTLEPGQQISSERFSGSTDKNLAILIVASRPGYEVRLMNTNEIVFDSRMDDTASLNLGMQDTDYHLYICNTTGAVLNLEMYCTR